MITRRDFVKQSSFVGVSALFVPSFLVSSEKPTEYGVQLYTFRNEMADDALGTLKKIADLGITKIETARSSKGHYYGLKPLEMKMACDDLGMKLVSGHVHVDEYFDKTIEEAVQSGQEYLICSTMPFKGQNSDTYKRVADLFNVAGEKCRSNGLKFGYHNHEYEFETDGDEILYDILMDNTDPELVYMELDLGWVVAAGKKPIDYFKKYEGRFPCWHLKDMNLQENESTEFGKGALDIALMLQNKELSGTQHIFIEQEEYAENAFASMQHNMQFLKGLY